MRAKTSAAQDNRVQQSRLQGVDDFLRAPARPSRIGWKRAPILIAGALLVQPVYPQSATILNESFETGAIQSSTWNESNTDGCNTTVETGDAADGTRYMRSVLTANSPLGGNFRCELNGRGIGETTPVPSIRYYGFAFRVPADFASDRDTGDVIAQLHYGAGSGGHYAVRINEMSVNWEAQGTAAGGGGYLFPLQRSVWTRVCIRVAWASDNTGAVAVWVNPANESSTPVRKTSGHVTVPEGQQAGKFKIGLYKPRWRSVNFPSPFNAATSPRVVEHDDVRVGMNFADACSGGGGEPTVLPAPPISVAVE